MPKVDLDKFLKDPAHQADRDFMNGVIDARLTTHAEDAKKKRKKPDSESDNPIVNLFDSLFGGEDDE